jgi:hypothetical protein
MPEMQKRTQKDTADAEVASLAAAADAATTAQNDEKGVKTSPPSHRTTL